MKLTRKVLALVLALTMLLGLAVSVSAASTTTITINGAISGATYNGYRILNLSAALKGTCGHSTDPEHDANCYNLSYTLNSMYETILKDVTGKTTEDEILAYIGAMSSNSDAIRTFADAVYAGIKAATPALTPDDVANTSGVFEEVDQGYWLIEEVMPSSHDEADHSLVMLTTMGIRNITVNTKRDNVELDKEVYHDDRASWDIVGDNQIGDTVYFHTESHVPDTDGFTELFVYVIHDKMSTGLTSNVVTGNTNGDLTVTINAADGTALAETYYDVYAGTDANGVVLGQYTKDGVLTDKVFNCTEGCTFHVIFDIKAALADGAVDDDDMLFTNYSAVLNEDATVYQAPGDHEKNQARVDYSNNPYDESETTETPWDETFEYTFNLNVKKTDAVTDAVIEGAKFVLSSASDKTGTDFDANKDGKLEVTDTLIEFIHQTVEVDGVDVETYTVKPANYVLTDAEKAEGKSLTYVIDAGKPVIKGLNDATDYYLYETVAPAGYNAKTTATRIKIFVEYNADGTMKDGYPKVQVDSTEQGSTLEVVIENSTGTVMPSTGGIGTTLFYIFGGIMFAGAAILLVTKKRMAV